MVGSEFFSIANLPYVIAAGCSLIAAASDAFRSRIPNALTVPVWFGGMAWSAYTGGMGGLGVAGAGSVILALPFLLLFSFGAGGAGDAKLMGAIGAWVGMENWLVVLMCVVLSGLVLAVGYAAVHGRIRTVASNVARITGSLFVLVFTRRWSVARPLVPDVSEMQAVPYGLAICLGVCAAAGYQLLWQW